MLIFIGITAAAVGVAFAVEAEAMGDALSLADRLPLGAGVAAYLVGMGTIRAVTRRLDRVAILRLVVAVAVLVAALAGFGLSPLPFVAIVALLLVAEAGIELRLDPVRPGMGS